MAVPLGNLGRTGKVPLSPASLPAADALRKEGGWQPFTEPIDMILPLLLATIAPGPMPAGPENDTLKIIVVAADSTPFRRLDGSFDLVGALAEPAHPDSQQQRRARAVQYSDGYYTRLSIHRAMSYAMLPLFAGSFITGTMQYDGDAPGWSRSLHKPLAIGTGIVFSVNTVTGLWNLIESNKNPEGRTRRWVHGIGMLVADAGFAYAGAVLGPEAKEDPSKRGDHRAVALASMGLSVANWTFMLLTR